MKSPSRSTMQLYPNKFKLILTICCFYIFINLGIISVLPTVALIDLAYLMDSSFTQLSLSLTFDAIAALISSILCGLLFKKVDRRICLIVLMVIFSLMVAIIPYLSSVPLFMLVMIIKGAAVAALDVGGNAWVLELWGDKCNTYMQALHFSFGLGIAVAPMIITPFMGLDPTKVANSTEIKSTPDNSLTIESIRTDKVTAKPVEHFQLVFVLAGIIGMLCAVLQFVLFIVENRKMSHFALDTTNNNNNLEMAKEETKPTSEQGPDPNKKWALGIGFVLILFYVGMEINSLRFITEYVHFLGYDLVTSGHQATILNTSYAVARFIGIFMSRFVSTDVMVIAHLSMIMVSALILVFLAQVSLAWITIGLLLFGAGCSIIFPSVFAMLEERTKMTNFAVGLVTAGAVTPSIIYPSVMPAIMEKFPMIYVYNILVSIVISFIAVVVLIKKVPKLATK